MRTNKFPVGILIDVKCYSAKACDALQKLEYGFAWVHLQFYEAAWIDPAVKDWSDTEWRQDLSHDLFKIHPVEIAVLGFHARYGCPPYITTPHQLNAVTMRVIGRLSDGNDANGYWPLGQKNLAIVSRVELQFRPHPWHFFTLSSGETKCRGSIIRL